MKILYILILTSFSQISFSQLEWGKVGTKWIYTTKEDRADWTDNETFTVTKDTFFQNRICKVIRSNKGEFEIMYKENESVYYWFLDKFNLIYKYDVKKGDTVYFDTKAVSEYQGHDYYDTIVKLPCVLSHVFLIDSNSSNPIRFYFFISLLETGPYKFLAPSYLEYIGFQFVFIPAISNSKVERKLLDIRCFVQEDFVYKGQNNRFPHYPCDTIFQNEISIQDFNPLNTKSFNLKYIQSLKNGMIYIYFQDGRKINSISINDLKNMNESNLYEKFSNGLNIVQVISNETILNYKILKK